MVLHTLDDLQRRLVPGIGLPLVVNLGSQAVPDLFGDGRAIDLGGDHVAARRREGGTRSVPLTQTLRICRERRGGRAGEE